MRGSLQRFISRQPPFFSSPRRPAAINSNKLRTENGNLWFIADLMRNRRRLLFYCPPERRCCLLRRCRRALCAVITGEIKKEGRSARVEVSDSFTTIIARYTIVVLNLSRIKTRSAFFKSIRVIFITPTAVTYE